jgi:hypothetical protein
MNILVSNPEHVGLIRAISDVGYLVVDGERPAYWGFNAVERGNLPLLPPAPWSDLPATCQTCDGKGRLEDPKRGRWTCSGCHWRCPDCVAGRPVHTLQATCPTHEWTPKGFDDEWRCQACDKCGGTGRISLGRFTVDVLPVLDAHAPPEICPKGNYIERSPGSTSLVEYTPFDDEGGTWDWRPGPPLDPHPLPDQFVVRLERQ